MLELIILRNIVESGASVTAKVGFTMPMTTPTTIEIRIHDVSGMRRMWRIMSL
jgi:hypothetical protein